jgi:hypothetical protein
MADENTALSPSIALRKEVVERLTASGGKVRDLVVNELVESEITKRKTAVVGLLTKVDEKYKELKKAQAQGTQNFNLAGQPVGEPIFTKQQVEAVKKLTEEIERIQTALEKAFSDGDFKKVYELAG